MMRCMALVAVGGLCLSQVACSGGPSAGCDPALTGRETSDQATGTKVLPRAAGQATIPEQLEDTAYEDLKCGGSMYAGTVVSVTVTGKDERKGADPAEWGTITFRVAKTVKGPPHDEMVIRYFYWLNDARRKQGGPVADFATDIGGSYSPWPARPQPGERLLLLLADEKMARKFYSKVYGNVYSRWEVNPDDPLVDGFTLAGRYLAAEGKASANDLFVQLCQSRFENMRAFARSAAFAYVGWSEGDTEPYHFRKGYDGARQSHLVLLYLKHAASRLRPKERLHVTHAFVFWFENTLEGVTDELLAAFDDWYMKEFSVRDDMQRPYKALESLKELVEKRGMPTAIGLFKKSGRDGLLKQLHECAHAGSPDVEKQANELLAQLEEK